MIAKDEQDFHTYIVIYWLKLTIINTSFFDGIHIEVKSRFIVCSIQGFWNGLFKKAPRTIICNRLRQDALLPPFSHLKEIKMSGILKERRVTV